MKITICGSMQFEPKMVEITKQLEARGYDVDKPNSVEGHARGESKDLDNHFRLKRGFIDEHFRKIDSSEAILVVNETKNGVDNYIGGSTLIEIGYAYGQGLDVFLLNPLPEQSYSDEVRAMTTLVLDGSLDKLDDYMEGLPTVYMSTASALKHRVISRVMRRVGVPVRVVGEKYESEVDEQPMSIDETRQGALNRQANMLKSGVEADYYATIESGLHTIHDGHNLYGVNVVVIQPKGGKVEVGIGLEVEVPKEMTDKVPSVYPDMGVFVQKEFGSKEKDPIPYLTGHHRTRQEVTEFAAYNLVSKLFKREDA